MTRIGVLNFCLRQFARPFLARTKAPEKAARDFRRAAKYFFFKPKGLGFQTNQIDGGVPISRITCGPVNDHAAILFFHGGGYVAGSAWTHRGMLARLSQLSGVPVYAPDYRLAQTAPFPAAFEDARKAWDDLRVTHPADRIILGGDSAGGGLALSLLAALLKDDERPGGLFAFSPWTDLTLTGASLEANEPMDAILPRSRMSDLCEVVLDGANPTDPRVSPLFAEFDNPPPTYIQASQTEILLDDARRITDHLHAAGGNSALDLWVDCPHVWQIFDGWVPEARDALQRTADFVQSQLNPVPPPQSEN